MRIKAAIKLLCRLASSIRCSPILVGCTLTTSINLLGSETIFPNCDIDRLYMDLFTSFMFISNNQFVPLELSECIYRKYDILGKYRSRGGQSASRVERPSRRILGGALILKRGRN
jgi:hypothetical protein